MLGAPVAQQLIDLICASDQGGNEGPTIPPLVNNTQPMYVVDTYYTKTIDGVVITHFTTIVIREFWEVSLSLLPKNVHALWGENITHPKDLALFNSTEFESVIRRERTSIKVY